MQFSGAFVFAIVFDFLLQLTVSTSTPGDVFTSSRHRKMSHYTSTTTEPSEVYQPPHEFPKNKNESRGIEIKSNSELGFQTEEPPTELPDESKIEDMSGEVSSTIPPLPPLLIKDMNENMQWQEILKWKLTQSIDDARQTEDEIRHPELMNSSSKVNSSAEKLEVSNKEVPALIQGKLAALLAGVFVCICVVAYVGMLLWRRYLERRYGNRQLINESEFDTDAQYFTI